MPTSHRRCALLLVPAILCGCAADRGLFGTVGPDYVRPSDKAAATWQAPLPHGGEPTELARFWSRFNDPALTALIDAAQGESASLAQAASRIEQARANALIAGTLGHPSLDLIGTASRSAFSFGGPTLLRNQVQLGVQSSWELDLFGGSARNRQAAGAQLASSAAAWHDARVSLAAEVANSYISYRYCEIQARIAQTDRSTRDQTARLTDIAAKAGFQSPAAAALAQATAADAANGFAQRRTQCEVAVKGLVSLTGLQEPALRRLLELNTAQLPEASAFRVESVPARALAQRPDIAQAERDLAAASAQIGVQAAALYPSVTLSGNILPTRLSINGGPTLSLETWSIGPSLLLPLFDGGRREASVEAARAQYRALDTAYRAKVRNAVREVEEALVRLQGAEQRMNEILKAVGGLKASLDATEVRVKAGFASDLELQESRRAQLTAEASLAAWQHERVSAWIALYRALGGGWDGALDVPSIAMPAHALAPSQTQADVTPR